MQLDDDRENAFLNLKKFLEDHPVPILLKPDDSIKRYIEGKETLKKMYTHYDNSTPDKPVLTQ